MIPDEAVEAATKVLFWQDEKPETMAECTKAARQLLEAAAPYLMAQAWDEGVSDGQWNAEHIYQIDAGSRHAIPNPYRSQA